MIKRRRLSGRSRRAGARARREGSARADGSDGAGRAMRMRVAGANAFEASDVAVKIGERVLFFAKMSDGQVHVGQLTAP